MVLRCVLALLGNQKDAALKSLFVKFLGKRGMNKPNFQHSVCMLYLFWQWKLGKGFRLTYFFVRFSDSCAPFEQFWLKMWLDNLLDYVLVTTIAKAIQVALHFFIDDSFLVPSGPYLSFRWEVGWHEKFLVLTQLLQNLVLAFKASVFHYLHFG